MTEPLAIEVALVKVDPRRASTIVHMAARVLIGARLGVYPTLVAIDHDARGRPVVEGVSVSLTHSGGLGAIAIAEPGHDIGVDVEAVRARRHAERIARRIFDADALVRWSALPDDTRPRAFLQRWTQVEAILKAKGTGVAGGFASAVPVPAGWSCEPIDAGADFVGAVAADTPAIQIDLRRLRSHENGRVASRPVRPAD